MQHDNIVAVGVPIMAVDRREYKRVERSRVVLDLVARIQCGRRISSQSQRPVVVVVVRVNWCGCRSRL